MPRARLTSKGQITIPKEVRDRLGLEPGDAVDFTFTADGQLAVEPVRRRSVSELRGMFAVSQALDIEEERALARTKHSRRLRDGTG